MINTHEGVLYKSSYTWQMLQNTTDWAVNNIKMTTETSAFAGDFSFDITPHLKGMCDDFDKPSTVFQWVKASTQTAKTSFLFIAGVKTLDTVGGMVQISIPLESEVKQYISTKINPFIQSVPTYRDAIQKYAKETTTATKDNLKVTYSGKWVIAGNTALARNAKSIKVLLLDEIRLFKGGMADVSEFINRTKSFSKMGRKIVGVSSWEHIGDPIDQSYLDCELKKEWCLQCPSCHELFYPTSNNLKFLTKDEYMKEFNKDENTYHMLDHLKIAKERKAHLVCTYCKHEFDSYTKDRLIKEGKCGFKIVEGEEGAESIGYLVNALATYFTPFDEMMTLIIKANESINVLARIYRDYFNELYSSKIDIIDIDDIHKLGSGLNELVIPEDTYKIFLGVDNQKDHVYWVLSAVTYDNVQYTIAHGKAVSNDTDEDFEFVRDLFTRMYKSIDKYFQVSGIIMDLRGYKKGSVDRIAEAKAFLVSLQDYIDSNGITDQEVFGCLGVDKLFDDQLYKVSNRKEVLDDDVEVKYKTLVMSNTAIKDDLAMIISRTLNKVSAKDESEKGFNYVRRLFYVNETIISDEKEFIANHGKLQMKHYSMQLTAEQKDLMNDGIWTKIRTRNDYLDCHAMIHTLNLYFNVDFETKQYQHHR